MLARHSTFNNHYKLHPMNTLIKETDSFSIEYDVETNSILHTVKSFLVTDEWKDLLTTGHHFFAENKLSKWISDNRDLPVLHNNIDAWFYNDWLPGMIETGWKQWAMVEPTIHPGKLSQKSYLENIANLGIEVRSFEGLEEAREWIK